jgi:hypothetical protein
MFGGEELVVICAPNVMRTDLPAMRAFAGIDTVFVNAVSVVVIVAQESVSVVSDCEVIVHPLLPEHAALVPST